MTNEVIWTKLVLERFIQLANLTEEEEIVIRTRAAGWSRVKQAMELNISILNRIQKCGFEEKRLLSVANARQGWYRMAAIRDINFLLNPTILGKKTKSRPGLTDPLAYYLS